MIAKTYHQKLLEITKSDQFKKKVNPARNSEGCILREENRLDDELQCLHHAGKITDKLLGQFNSIGGQPPKLHRLNLVLIS